MEKQWKQKLANTYSIMQNDYQNQNQDPEEHHRNMVNRVANNEGFNLNRQGNEGRYTRSHNFQNTD